MKIVAITGSPRLEGNTAYLTDQALEAAGRAGADTLKIDLVRYRVNPCQGHDECNNFTACPQADDAGFIMSELYAADGVILASPVYYYTVSAQLKALIDRNSFYRRHKWRMKAQCAGIIVVAQRAGTEDTANTLKHFLALSSRIPAEAVEVVSGYAFKAGEIKSNHEVVEQARRLGSNMARRLAAS